MARLTGWALTYLASLWASLGLWVVVFFFSTTLVFFVSVILVIIVIDIYPNILINDMLLNNASPSAEPTTHNGRYNNNKKDMQPKKHNALGPTLIASIVVIVAFGVGVFTLGGEAPHKLPPSEFISLYKPKHYQSLISKLSSEKHAIVEGKDEDGVDVFVSYLLNLTLPDQQTVIQRVFQPENPDIQDPSYPLFSSIKTFIAKNVGSSGTDQVWVIDCNGPLTSEQMQAAYHLAQAHPKDRIIMVTPSAPIKSKLFKKFVYQRPDNSQIRTLLKNQGLSKDQIDVVLQNHKNNLEDLRNTFQADTLLNFEEVFKDQKESIGEELLSLEPKEANLIKKLCRYGKLPSKTEIPELGKLKSVGFDNGTYYWHSNNYVNAYESLTGSSCNDPEVFISTKTAGKAADQTAESDQDQQEETLSKHNKKKQDKEDKPQNEQKQKEGLKQKQKKDKKQGKEKNPKEEKKKDQKKKLEQPQKKVKSAESKKQKLSKQKAPKSKETQKKSKEQDTDQVAKAQKHTSKSKKTHNKGKKPTTVESRKLQKQPKQVKQPMVVQKKVVKKQTKKAIEKSHRNQGYNHNRNRAGKKAPKQARAFVKTSSKKQKKEKK